MSHYNGKIYGEAGTPNIGVSIRDVQCVLGTSMHYLHELCTHQNINPMAKYKPIRLNKKEMLSPEQGSTPSDRYAARFGFASIAPRITFNGNTDPHAKWEYLKPRGGAYNEWFRLTDFANEADPTKYGYNAGALPPFVIGVEGLELTANSTEDGEGGVGILLYVNSGVNSYFNGGGFESETCMTISELLNFYNGSSYIGFAIQDITSPTGGFVAVVTRHQLKNVSSSVPAVVLYSKNHQTQGSLFSPAVDLLHQGADRAGHTFRFIAFMYDHFPSFTYNGTTYNANNAEYTILTTTPNFDAYSLEFIDNIDRCDIVATLIQGGILGLTGYIYGSVSLTIQNNGNTVIYNGRQYYQYRIGGTIFGSFTTPTGHWDPDGDVRIHLRISGSGRPSVVDSNGNSEIWVNVDLSAGNTTSTHTLVNFSSLSQPIYLYVEPAVAKEGAYISVSAYATPSYLTTQRVQIDGIISATAPRVTS